MKDLVYIYVYVKETRWAIRLRHPKSGKIMTPAGTNPKIENETELTIWAINYGISLLKRPCNIKIFGLIPIDDPRYSVVPSDTPDIQALMTLA